MTGSILQGKSIKGIADDLQSRITTMNRDSAIRAARTAVTGAQNAGRMDSYAAAEKMGIKLEKEWLATLDGRTRHSHAVLDGEQVAQDKAFSNGCRFPGDPKGAPGEIYNCRCTLTAIVEGVNTSNAKRRARNGKTGQTEAASDVTYSEWAGKKTLANSVKSGMVKSLDVDDFVMVASSKELLPEVSDVISKTIKEFEADGGMYISSANFGDFYDEASGKPALFQIMPNQYGLIELNVNNRLLGGVSLEEATAMIAGTKMNLPETLQEAVAHECGHAKLIHGLNPKEIEVLYTELAKIHVDGVSLIALEDGTECIAEVEVLLYRNEKVPIAAKKLYDKYMRRVEK